MEYAVYIVLLAAPTIAFILMILSMVKPETLNQKAIIVILFFFIVCIVLLGFFFNLFGIEGGVPLQVYSDNDVSINGYAPLSNKSIATAIVYMILSAASYWILNNRLGQLSPIVCAACQSSLILFILFAFTYVTHTGFSHYDDPFPIGFSIMCLQSGLSSLCFLYIIRLKTSMRYFFRAEQEKGKGSYNHPFLDGLHRFFMRFNKAPYLLTLPLFPVLVVIQLILVLFGQRPDSFIKVFLHTSTFNYSQLPAPAPVIIPGDGHYLCTVAAKGHEKWVKPLRSGLRHGSTIIVNRQLLIANAFEHILEEHVPNCHRVIRKAYDRYGYPVSKHIQSKWSADIVYLFMKPLEWFFLLVIYSVDKNPESRIHIQYSELRK